MSEARNRERLRPYGVLIVALAALSSSCLERRSDDVQASDRARCTSCHGDATRAGDAALRSAPPRDLLGATDPSYPGVGAHTIHLEASATHAAIACDECHVIPERVDSPGHADDARPAELVFGYLARAGDHSPAYDPVARTCQDSHCHGAADAVWTEPRTSEQACGTCHELPPPAPHPASDRCSSCHGQVVDERMKLIAPELHVDGVTQQSPGECSSCHGGADNPAPPFDTRGNSDETRLGVGAHRAHLTGGAFSRPLVCTECHDVPARDDVPAHVGPLPAEVRLLGVAETDRRMPSFSHQSASCTDNWCHGPGPGGRAESPSWISATALDCSSCHELPPPAPHPASDRCSSCHGEVIADDDLTIAKRSSHVDGIVDVAMNESCTSCHGDENPAPPRDLSGNTSTSARGVGAHQIHLTGTERARAVGCNECHVVPDQVLAPGHLDSGRPAEVSFAGVALAFDDEATYANGTCSNVSCHGAVLPEGHASGGTDTAPSWLDVTGVGATCGSCHALPPPAPHPRGDLNPICSACHENIDADNFTFNRPDLHVDGVVTFILP